MTKYLYFRDETIEKLMERRMRFLTMVLGVMLVLAACGGADDQTSTDDVVQVVTTLGQIADIAKIVGGEHVAVHGMMGPGVDPHLYVASESDVERLQNAELILYNGLFLEAQMSDVLEQLGKRKPTRAVGEAVDKSRLLPWANYKDEFDPHVWFDVTIWAEAVKATRDAFSEVDPEHADDYAANAAGYLEKLDALHAYVKEQADRVPKAQRVLITAHDAFQYFGRAYGFEVRGLQGISTAAEAGTADVQELATFIADRQIPAIFIESSVAVRNVEALQAAVASKGFDVVIGGELFSDAMGDPATPEGSYIGMVRHNIDTIVSALLGESGTAE